MKHAPLRRFILPPFAVAVALLLTACGGGGDASAPRAFNDADVTFLQNMLPHHSQAVEMAEQVGDRTSRPELLELADQVIATQSDEVEVMRGLLEQAGAEPMEGMDDMSMPGMMGEQEMAELEGLRDQQFDLAFLRMMTEHHQGAIEMAETELADGDNLKPSSSPRRSRTPSAPRWNR